MSSLPASFWRYWTTSASVRPIATAENDADASGLNPAFDAAGLSPVCGGCRSSGRWRRGRTPTPRRRACRWTLTEIIGRDRELAVCAGVLGRIATEPPGG